MKDPLIQFGQRLRDLRNACGLSQEDFAHKAGIDRSYLGGVERGERNISLINISKIADTLEITLAELMDSRAGNNSAILFQLSQYILKAYDSERELNGVRDIANKLLEQRMLSLTETEQFNSLNADAVEKMLALQEQADKSKRDKKARSEEMDKPDDYVRLTAKQRETLLAGGTITLEESDLRSHTIDESISDETQPHVNKKVQAK